MTDLPQGWEWATLGEVGEWSGGATPSKSNDAFWNNGTIPWISPKDINSPTISQSVDYITESALAGSPVRLIPPNSVVIVVRSGILERTIPSAIVPFATTLNQDLKALTPYSGISYKWIAYCLRAFEKNMLRGLCKSLFEEVQADSGAERGQEGLQRSSVISEENPPCLEV
ncbi:MAG: restriction endonuclease subunit S, partial [Pseudonocardiaceae bacterium]